jgi:hypothetical protein
VTCSSRALVEGPQVEVVVEVEVLHLRFDSTGWNTGDRLR